MRVDKPILPLGDASSPDVRGTYRLTMPMNAALTARIVSTTRFLPVSTLWARFGRAGFLDSPSSNSGALRVVLNHPSKLARRPLMQPSVHLAAVVDAVTDAAHIADRNRRDASLKEHLYDLPAQFIEEVRDLVVDVVELLTLRFGQLLPAIRASLFAVDLLVELGLQLIYLSGSERP